MSTLEEGYEARELLGNQYEAYRNKLKELGYKYVTGGIHDDEYWERLVHPDFYELALKHKSNRGLNTQRMAEELGIELLPNGAVLYGLEWE